MATTNFVAGTTIASSWLNDVDGSIYQGQLDDGTTNASIDKYTPAGTGAVATTVQAKMRESVSILDFIPVAEHAAIKAGTSTYDCYAAMADAIASFPDPIGNIYYAQAGTLYFPPGKYYCSTTVQVERAVAFLGANAATAGNASSVSTIEFAVNITGFSVQRYNTGVSGKGGDGASFENLTIQQKTASATGDGIRARARIVIRNCTLFYWGGSGVRIIASAGAGGALEGNANNFRIENTTSSFNIGDGFYFSGADANAGTIIGCDASSNGGHGFNEASFLGNTYIGCHGSGNTTCTYYVPINNNARNVFVGCYDESGYAACEINSTASVVIGGLWGSGFTSTTAKTLDGNGLTNSAVGSSTSRSSGKFSAVDMTGKMGQGTETPDNGVGWSTARVFEQKGGSNSLGGVFLQSTLDDSAKGYLTTMGGASAAMYLYTKTSADLKFGTNDITRMLIQGSTGHVEAGADNTQTLGTASKRWSTVYAGTGAINTSDGRLKQQIRTLSEAEKAVARRVKGLLRAYKFNDAVEQKGDQARIHFGVIAQDLVAAFNAEGLNADHYALLCYDQWAERPEIKDTEGNITQSYLAAGDRYGVRYDELVAFLIAAM